MMMEMAWHDVEDELPPENKLVIIRYVFNYGDDEPLHLSEYGRGSIIENNYDQLSFKKNNIWTLHTWAHNPIIKKTLKKYKVTHWCFLPEIDEYNLEENEK